MRKMVTCGENGTCKSVCFMGHVCLFVYRKQQKMKPKNGTLTRNWKEGKKERHEK